MAEFEGFAPGTNTKDCTDRDTFGTKSTKYTWIYKGNAKQSDYPDDACTPFYHGNAQIDNLQVNEDLTAAGTVQGNIVNATSSVNSVVKSFNIPHPSKKGKRLFHGCLEGPEHAVYVRGWVEGGRTIFLPEYWPDLVDMNSITIQLTQIGSSQDLIVEKIDGLTIVLKSGTGTSIRCYYTVTATRKDVPPLKVEQDA